MKRKGLNYFTEGTQNEEWYNDEHTEFVRYVSSKVYYYNEVRQLSEDEVIEMNLSPSETEIPTIFVGQLYIYEYNEWKEKAEKDGKTVTFVPSAKPVMATHDNLSGKV